MPDLSPAVAGLSREELLECAKNAEVTERYAEMVQYMQGIIKSGVSGDEITVEERNLISVGYKNIMSLLRSSWRTVHQKERDEENEGNEAELALVKAYKEHIAQEIYELIEKVQNEVTKVFVSGPQKPTVESDESFEVVVFFQKMEGDYCRYGAEISEGDTRMQYKEKARQAYSAAQKLADDKLDSTNPILLGLALNFSVFYYEICEERQMASELAKVAFDKAIDNLDKLPEEKYKDSTLIMQLLKDNLTLWSEAEDDNGIEVEEIGDA
jgi:14-3-3 protein epsilon